MIKIIFNESVAAQLVSLSLTNSEIAGSSPALQSLIARGGGRKPVSLISPTAQRVAVIGHNRAIIPPLIRHTSQPASSRLNMVCIKKKKKKIPFLLRSVKVS